MSQLKRMRYGIKHLKSRHFSLLESYFISKIKLTDMAIQYLSGVCSYLRVLDISDCHLIRYLFCFGLFGSSLFLIIFLLNYSSEKSLKYLRKGCKHMKRVYCINCTGIKKEAIDKLRNRMNEVDYIYKECLLDSALAQVV